jgi:hypothetical protein
MTGCGFTSHLYIKQDWSKQKKREKQQHVTPTRHSHFTYLHIQDAIMCTVMATVFHSLGY